MHWSALLVLAFTGPTQEVAHFAPESAYSSYADAWHAAHDSSRPMLVILNPAEGQNAIDPQQLQANEALQPLLEEYVVAVIDTGTEHGKKDHQLFGSASLPRVVVIDKEQKKQVYKASGKISTDRLATVLDECRSGKPKPEFSWAQPNSGCKNCQRRLTF